MSSRLVQMLRAAAGAASTDPAAVPLHGAPAISTRPGVLLLHGFTGHPGELHYAAERFTHAGYHVSVPRLPGHGTSGADFEQTGAADWLRRALDAYLDLRAELRGDAPVVLGLSMGALLASLLAAELPARALVLCAPALEVNQPWLPATPVLGRVLPSYRGTYNPDKIEPEFRGIAAEYRSRRWVRAAGELYKLQVAARKALARLRCPVTTVLASDDPTVPVSVATRIQAALAPRIGVDHETRVFASESHVVLNSDIRDQVLEYIIHRISKCVP